MEAEQIEVVGKWPEPKSVWDIQVFLGFANFYWQFIQGFSRIAAPLTSMLKMAAPPEKPTLEEVGDGEGGDGVDSGGVEIAKKSRKSKDQKLVKSKKLSKSGNLPNFNAKEAGLSFLIPGAREAFNRLRLAFTEALIFWNFDPECHIQIKTDVSGYAIGGMLSQLASKTSLDRIVTKIDLGQ